MKSSVRFLTTLIALATMLLSACGAVNAPANTGGAKALYTPVEFTGVIESQNGNEWTIDGQTITVDPSVLDGQTFQVGDVVKVEGQLAEDGSVNVTSVEPSSPDDLEDDLDESEDSSDDDSSSDDSPSLVSGAGIQFDDDGQEAVGTVDAVSADSITIGGQTFTFSDNVEGVDQIQSGDAVKIHFMEGADGSLIITEIELADPSDLDDDLLDDNDEDEDDDEDEDEDEDEDDGEDDDSGSDSSSDDD